MAEPYWMGEGSRKIDKRLVVESDLVLQSPAALGNGDTDETIDLPLLVDPLEGRPLLTGTSIAGALRAYLLAWEHGYEKRPTKGSASVMLFGEARGDDEGRQSPLIVEDAIAEPKGVEFRDGVRLDPESRTAADDALFNRLVWPAGTMFPLRFELLIGAHDKESSLKAALATALHGLQRGEIALGARKERGYGRAKVEAWRVKEYVLNDSKQLLAWLEHGANKLAGQPGPIGAALGVKDLLPDRREGFTLSAKFKLDGALLIAGTEDTAGPDKAYLRARQANGAEKPVLSGTSLTGALRMRALKIARTLGDEAKARELVTGMFGPEAKTKSLRASRLRVAESVIETATTELVQTRVSIDRFTGGALDSALFNAQPVFGGELKMDFSLRKPGPEQIGLLLLLLKDLWTGDLALGGEINAGRGRFKGQNAHLCLKRAGTEPKKWVIHTQGPGKLRIEGDRQALEDCVSKDLKDYFESTSETGGVMSWRRTLIPVREFAEPLKIPNAVVIRTWLEGQAATHGLVWLLAHADDGVIWGRFENGQLLTAREATSDPRSGPIWREITLQQARLFSEHAELLLWREDGDTRRARLIRGAKEEEEPNWIEAYDEKQLLWGLTGQNLTGTFTRLEHAGIGCAHVPPIKVELKDGKPVRPPCLITRNFLNAKGPARVEASRLAGFAYLE